MVKCKLFAVVMGLAVMVWAGSLVAEEKKTMKLQANQPNVIALTPVDAKFVRVSFPAGSVCLDELEVFAPGAEVNLALATSGAKATASASMVHKFHKVEHLNDGRYGNAHSWIAAAGKACWAQVELSQVSKIDRVVISRDREGKYRDRLPRSVTVEVSSDGTAWTKLVTVTNK